MFTTFPSNLGEHNPLNEPLTRPFITIIVKGKVGYLPYSINYCYGSWQWVLHFERLLWGLWVDFVSGSGIYRKKFFFAVLVISLILAFDNFQKLLEQIVKQIIPSKSQ